MSEHEISGGLVVVSLTKTLFSKCSSEKLFVKRGTSKQIRFLPFFLLLALAFSLTSSDARAQNALKADAKRLFELARSDGRFFSKTESLRPEILPTSDDRSFSLIYRETKNPSHWIVSLHGAGRPARGFASDDLAVWYPHLQGRPVGIICLQWWFGTGDRIEDFYKPDGAYREIIRALEHVGATSGPVLLHGFSRGSTNTFAIAVLDAQRGKKLFKTIVASSGGYQANYPPNRAIEAGDFGPQPLTGTHWFTVAGGRDPNQERDGITGMRATARWLRSQGAEVLKEIEDPYSGHGAFLLKDANSKIVLDYFQKTKQ